MGVLQPSCIATDGIRVYALSYAYDNSHEEGDPSQSSYQNPQYAILVQSKPYPDVLPGALTRIILQPDDIQKGFDWKVVNVVRSDSSFSWFKDEWAGGGSDLQTHTCGVTSRRNAAEAGDYVFTLHVTDFAPLITSVPDNPLKDRRMVIKLGFGADPEIRQDERPAAPNAVNGADVPSITTLAGRSGPRSALFPLNNNDEGSGTGTGGGGGDGPWVEALTPGIQDGRMMVQLSTMNATSGGFPAFVQDVQNLFYPTLDVAFGHQKLHILSQSGNCTRLTSVQTTVASNALKFAEQPTAAKFSPDVCYPLNNSRMRMLMRLGVSEDGIVHALNVVQEDRGTQGLTSEFRLNHYHKNTTDNSTFITQSNIFTGSGPFSRYASTWSEMFPLIPLPPSPSSATTPPSSRPYEESTSFLTGTSKTLVFISTQSTLSKMYSATHFNITIEEPYKYYPFRDPELLTKAQIGGIAAVCVAGLLLVVFGVHKYLQRRNRLKALAGMEVKDYYEAGEIELETKLKDFKEEEIQLSTEMNKVETDHIGGRRGIERSTASMVPSLIGTHTSSGSGSGSIGDDGGGRGDGLEGLTFSTHPRPQVTTTMEG